MEDRIRSGRDRWPRDSASGFRQLRGEVLEICRSARETDAGPRLRAACNDLALRITQSLVALQKGSALLMDHPAQRLAREALFFLVWSCPDPVIDCTIGLLMGIPRPYELK